MKIKNPFWNKLLLISFLILTSYCLQAQPPNTICGTAGENGTLVMTAPDGKIFTSITFASYGSPTGTCGSFAIGGCHTSNSKSIVEGLLIGQNSVTIASNNNTFGDPCVGTVKTLAVEAVYGDLPTTILPAPIVHYQLDGNAIDASGNGLNGTVTGTLSPVANRLGNANSASSFNGSTKVDVADNALLRPTNVTLSAWVFYPSIPSGTQMIATKNLCGGTGESYGLFFQSGSIGGSWSDGPSTLFLSVAAPTAGQWHLVTFTFDDVNNLASLYLDGALVNTQASNVSLGYDNSNFSIGYELESCSPAFGLNAQVDDVKIFGVVLTAAQVLAEFTGAGSLAQQKPGSGNALSLDGTDDEVTTTLKLIPTSGDFTVQLWVKNRSNSGFREFISQGASGDAFYLGINNLGTGELRAGDKWISTGAVLPLNQWTNLALVRSGTNAALFMNGISVATTTNYSISTGGTNTAFGRQYGGISEFADSEIDEVRIWNTALTQAQIRDRMCRKITSGDALFSNLLAYYNFDETTGTNAFDGTANANHGTLVNGATRVVSGAAIGNSSTHNYVTAGFPAVNLSFSGQDNLAVNYTSGIFTGEAGTHVYVVNEKPNTESGIENPGTNNRYFGVFNAGLTNPQYTATYNYNGNPFVTVGNESQLGLFKRNDNAGTSWTNSTATLNTTANTLTATGQSTEYVLGVGTCVTPPIPTITAGGQTSFCANGSLGLVSSSPTGNQWLLNGSPISGATSSTFSATSGGSYTLKVSAGSCFSMSVPLVVTALPLPTVGISASAPGLCPNGTVTLSTSGSALVGREWLKEGITTGIGTTTFPATTAGNYSVIGTSANGCQATSSVLPIQADLIPVLSSDKPANTICSGNSIILTSSPGANFLWNTSATTASITVSPSVNTKFSVRTIGAFGCVFNDTVQVSVVPSLTPSPVSGMLPENASINQENSIHFSWQPATNALSYDLYVWPAPGARPASPTATGLVTINTTVYNLNFSQLYNYQIVSRSACQQTNGPVQQFTTRSLPDLVVSNVQSQAVIGVPGEFTVTYTVTNQGTGVSLPGTWKDKLFLSIDSAEGFDIELSSKDNVNALAPGASYNGLFSLIVSQSGEYFLYVKTDAAQSIIETNESNNLKFRNPGRVNLELAFPRPDLAGTGGFATATSALGGQAIAFAYGVKNQGNLTATGLSLEALCGPPSCNPTDSYWEDQVFISPDSAFGVHAVPLGFVKVIARKFLSHDVPQCNTCNGYYNEARGLAADSAMVVNSNDLVIPFNYTGKAFLIVKMNSGSGSFDEFFTQNNTLISRHFNVILNPPADLEVTTVTASPTSSQQGNSAKVKYRITNKGFRSPRTNETPWTDKVYLSTTPVLNKNTAKLLSTKSFPLSELAFNAFYEDSVTFQIPFLEATPLYIFVEADANNQVFEHTFKANNINTGTQLTLDLSKKPDYVPSALTIASSIQAGSSLPLNFTINNTGNASGAGSFEVQYRIRPTGSPVTPTLIGTSTIGFIPQAGNTAVLKTIPFASNITAGSYELSAFVDANEIQPELNEGNNIATKTITVTPAPAFDLTLNTVTAPATIDIFQNQPSFQVGGTASFNISQAGPGIPTEVKVQIAVSQNASGAFPIYYKETILNFPTGIPATFTIPDQTINRNTVPEGNYFVVVSLVVDPSYETNPTNNQLNKPIFFAASPTPDLVFQTTPASLTLTAGASFSIPVQLKNTGVNELQNVCVTKAILANSPSTTPNGGTVLGSSFKIPGLFNFPTNQIVKDTIRGIIPFTLAGNYYLQLYVDADKTTYEGAAGEGNNIVNIPIVINAPSLPDLIISPLVLPASMEAGRNLSFNYTLRNTGTGSFSGQPKNTFRLSKTGSFNPFTDGETGTDYPTVGLNPGANAVLPMKMIASGLLPGAYKPGAFANSNFAYIESNFGNNESYSAGTTNLFINPLALNINTTETNFSGDYIYRSVNIGAGLDILAEFTGLSAVASLGKVPTSSTSDFASAETGDNQLIIPNSEGGQYYFGVIPTNSKTGSLKVRALPFSILSLSPGKVGKGNATVEIKGAAFTNQTLFVLRNGSGVPVDTGSIRILRNSMQARVTFHCGNLPQAFYTVRAIKPGNEFTDLVNGLQVVAKSDGKLVSTDNFPENIASNSTISVTYTFVNSGNTDIDNGFARLSFPTFADVKNISISSGADGLKSLLAKTGVYDLANTVSYEQYDFLTYIPAWKRNMAPGESFQISFEMNHFLGSSDIYVQTFGQSLTDDQFYQMIANQVEKTRAFSMQFREEISNTQIMDSLGGYWSFQHLAYQNLFQAGFFKPEEKDAISALNYYPSMYQPDFMKGYGIVSDPAETEDLSLRLLCPAPLSKYNLPTDKSLYFTIANGAFVTYSSNFRRTAVDLIASACAGDSTEFKRRISRQRGGGGFEGNLTTGFAYGPLIYTDIFGEYRPGQPFVPAGSAQAQGGPSIQDEDGGFWGNLDFNNKRELFNRPVPRPRPPAARPLSPKPAHMPFDPYTNFGDGGPFPFKKPDAECAGKAAPDCEVHVFGPKTVRCGVQYTVRTLIICHHLGDERSTFCFPNTPFFEEKIGLLKYSCDPNEIVGPDGFGDSKFVAKKDSLPFTILFENDPKFAEAAAGTVRIVQPLDANFEAGTFRLKQFGFDNKIYNFPPTNGATQQIDLTAERGIKVSVLGTIDILSKQLFWQFSTIDANTGLPPTDPSKGFLPVNDSTGKGEGFVSYSILPGLSTQTGDSLRAKAEIYFDFNEPVVTNKHFNVVDALPPVTSVISPSGTQADTIVAFEWTTADDLGGSGAASTWILSKKDGGPLDTLGQFPADTGSVLLSDFQSGHTYQFFFRTEDNVGNLETLPTEPQMTVTIGAACNLPTPTVTASGPLTFCAGDSVVLTSNIPTGNVWSNGSLTQSIKVKVGGTFSVKTMAAGCTSSVSNPISVTVNPLPVVNAGLDVSIAAGDSTTLTATGATTYLWSPLTTLTPSNGIGASVLAKPIQTTLYTVTGTNSTACTASDQVLVTVTGGSGPLTAPTISPPTGIYADPQLVSITSTSPGATIYYTTSGNVPVVGTGFTKLYTTPFTQIESGTIRAMAVKDGQANSPIAVSFITITLPGICVAPTITPGTGSYGPAQTVSISSSTSGAQIYYTTSGNTPVIGTSFTKLYVGSFLLQSSGTIRAMAVKSGLENSPVSVAVISITNPTQNTSTPVITPGTGSFGGPQTVSITCATSGSTIYFTTNGNVPRLDVPNSFTKVYSGPFLISQSATIRAIATAPAFNNSGVAVAYLTIGAGRMAVSDGDPVLENELNVFPNPSSSGYFQFMWLKDVENETRIEVLALDGRLIQRLVLKPNQQEWTLDLSHQPTGMYLVRIINDNQVQSRRITKQ